MKSKTMNSRSKNLKKKKCLNEREKNIELLKNMLNNRFSYVKSLPKTRPNSPNPEHYENIDLENIKKLKI